MLEWGRGKCVIPTYLHTHVHLCTSFLDYLGVKKIQSSCKRFCHFFEKFVSELFFSVEFIRDDGSSKCVHVLSLHSGLGCPSERAGLLLN